LPQNAREVPDIKMLISQIRETTFVVKENFPRVCGLIMENATYTDKKR
jgi:hypothetical protein